MRRAGLILGRQVVPLLKASREPTLIAFSTASSEATLPSAFKILDDLRVPPRISGLVLPLGYSFNLAGTLIYSSFCVIFIAQAYGIELSFERQIGILLFLLLINKGAAGVPRGALVGLTLTLKTFGLPVAGIGLILGVDAILDMGRTAINVFSNIVATACVAKVSAREGEGEKVPILRDQSAGVDPAESRTSLTI
jgi:Na+/H+-dicarboxylate symporter